MLPALKSEFRKLFTVRSTYIMIILALLLTALFAFLIEGYYGESGSPAATLAPTAYHEIVANAGGMTVLFVSIIAVLFMAHEYRYNTIMYTLTANARRSRVLAAKLLVLSGFAVVFSLVITLFALVMYQLGVGARGETLSPQKFDILVEFGRVVVYFVFYGLIGLLVAALLRNIVGAISVLLGLPIIVEPLLGLALKDNAVYLPITATDTIIGAALIQSDKLTPNSAMVVAGLYLVVGWSITWLLFMKRDAN